MKLFAERKSRQGLWLVVGLGNPGKEYEASRHNVGFKVADRWAESHQIVLDKKKPWALLGEADVTIDGSTVRAIVAKPRTFMNLSGEALVELVNRYHVDLSNTIVVYDDMDLPLGKVRLREKGSAGGHRGMANIVDRLGTRDIPRIRIGIGRPEDVRPEVVDYVLGRFKPGEREIIEQAVSRARDAIDCIMATGIAGAMNTFNVDPPE